MDSNQNKFEDQINITEDGSEIKKKKKYNGFSFKERLLPSLLVALVAPLTVCFVGPFEIYGNNSEEFKFVLGDFWGLCVIIAALAAILIAAVLLVCRKRVFDIIFGLVLGISVMFFVQSTFFSLMLTSLDGDGTGEKLPLALIIFNMALWVIVPIAFAVAVPLLNKFKSTVGLICTMLAGIIVFMSVVSFVTVSVSTDVYSDKKPSALEISPDEQRLLTVENLDTFATKENIVVFIVDRFDRKYVAEALEKCPEIFSELDGFTYFDDFVSHYPRTFPAIPYLVTGVTTDFSEPRKEYLETAYKNAPLMHALKNAGYDINVYTDTYYGYENASHMGGYATNVSLKMEYEIINKNQLSIDMLRLSLFRSLPFALRSIVGDISTPSFNQYVQYDTESEVFNTDMKLIYDNITDDDFTFRDAEKGYSFIHMAGCHLPNVYDENFEPVSDDDKWNSVFAMKQSFKIISRYIQEMKRMGVYDNSTIVIMGDHASIGSDSKPPYYAHMTSLFVKPSSSSADGIDTSYAQITTDDVFATILSAANTSVDGFSNRTVFDIPEDEERTRYYYFQCKTGGVYDCIKYEIKGAGGDLAHWNQVDKYTINKSIYN